MVRKLIKQEFIYYFRTLLPIELVMLGVALMTRCIEFFESPNIVYSIVSGSSLIAFFIAIIACMSLTAIYSITRFYRNLYTKEGYLTFALPATESQHIISKLIASVVANIATFINVIISICIATAGELCIEIFKAIGYIFNKIYTLGTGVNLIFYIIEFAILMLVALSCGILLFYACITIGQTAKKNKILAAVGVYFAYYFIVQILETIMVVIISTGVLTKIVKISDILSFIGKHPYLSVHLGQIFLIVFYALLGTLYFIVTKKVMSKKLNLE